jgi:glyoxylase-like metal-dependent hydrolase (beta-lactamase superfamily II)
VTVCATCGTVYDDTPERCAICSDERQYVPAEGQTWADWEEHLAAHRADLREEEGLLGVGIEPSFAIGQRALVVDGVLWDCVPYLDDAVAERVGPLRGIAISHPHYYSALVDWARRFECPVWLHEADREWIQRRDDRIELWAGDAKELGADLTLIRLGGHFPGGTVLHWAAGRALLSGDILQVLPGGRWVSFMWSYPMLVPLPAPEVERIAAALEPWDFDRVVGAWWGRVVRRDAKGVVRRSAERYVRALAGALPQ